MTATLSEAPPLLPTDPSRRRIGTPSAVEWPATRVLARRALESRPMSDPWRPSGLELDRIDTFLQRLGVTRVALRQTSTPGVEIVAVGSWRRAQVIDALDHLVMPEVIRDWEDALMRLPPADLTRVVAAVDGRTDKTTFHLAMPVQTTPDARQTAQIRALATHLGVPDEGVSWLASVHDNLTRFAPRTVLAQLALVGDSLRAWSTLRYPDSPPAAARAVRASLGHHPKADDELDTLLTARAEASAPVTVEARAARKGRPRVGVEA